MTKYLCYFALTMLVACEANRDESEKRIVEQKQIIECSPFTVLVTDSMIVGVYEGSEFSEKMGDIAHQLSNAVAEKTGNFLKSSYQKGIYLKVDFSQTKITTATPRKLGEFRDSLVRFSIVFPLTKVSEPVDAYTGIEHRGSWLGKITKKDALAWRKRLRNQIIVGKDEWRLFTTPEGLAEYWIQFQHKDFSRAHSKN
jgi:hypothetical protein